MTDTESEIDTDKLGRTLVPHINKAVTELSLFFVSGRFLRQCQLYESLLFGFPPSRQSFCVINRSTKNLNPWFASVAVEVLIKINCQFDWVVNHDHPIPKFFLELRKVGILQGTTEKKYLIREAVLMLKSIVEVRRYSF